MGKIHSLVEIVFVPLWEGLWRIVVGLAAVGAFIGFAWFVNHIPAWLLVLVMTAIFLVLIWFVGAIALGVKGERDGW